jgi:hypothetical protein
MKIKIKKIIPITSVLIGSATKRIHGALLSNGSKHNHYLRVHKATLMLITMVLIVASVFVVLIK